MIHTGATGPVRPIEEPFPTMPLELRAEALPMNVPVAVRLADERSGTAVAFRSAEVGSRGCEGMPCRCSWTGFPGVYKPARRGRRRASP